jgi:hypothetical protein
MLGVLVCWLHSVTVRPVHIVRTDWWIAGLREMIMIIFVDEDITLLLDMFQARQ